jgi:RNA-directed DNA polymerase
LRLQLKKKPDELVKAFFSLRRPQDIASLLEIPYGVLNYHLYIVPPSKQYTTFSVPKKSGDSREILAPITAIKIMQQKLNCILQSVYRDIYHKRKFAVHGFIYEKNIRTNASTHTKKEYVLNILLPIVKTENCAF